MVKKQYKHIKLIILTILTVQLRVVLSIFTIYYETQPPNCSILEFETASIKKQPISSLLQPPEPHSTFCLNKFDYFRYYMEYLSLWLT